MYTEKLSEDLSVGIFLETVDAHPYAVILFYVEWKDRQNGKPIVATSLNTLAGSIKHPQQILDIAKEQISLCELERIEAYMTPSGAKDMREITAELGEWMQEEEISDDDFYGWSED